MTILGFDHVQLAMPGGGEDRARAFYAVLLGLTEVPKPASLQSGGGAWFRGGRAELHLGVDPDFRPARKAHPALLVDAVDELAARLRTAGHDIEWDERYPGVRRFYVQDPFGNRIEILQPDPRAGASRRVEKSEP